MVAKSFIKELHCYAAAVFLAAIVLQAPSAAAEVPQVEDGTCTVFADKNFKGRGDVIAANKDGGNRLNLNDKSQDMDTNKKVSSLACGQFCTLILYEKPNQKGAAKAFSGAVPLLPKAWNDRASSIEIGCAGEAGRASSPAAPALFRCRSGDTLIVQFSADLKSMLVQGPRGRDTLENAMVASGSLYEVVAARPERNSGYTSFELRGNKAVVRGFIHKVLRTSECTAVE
jgi:hypothetical protein